MLNKYKIIINNSTYHDSDAALLDDKQVLCVLETERVSKHKHAMYENTNSCLVDYIKKQYNLKDDEVSIIDLANSIVPFEYRSHHELHAAASYYASGYDKAAILVIDGMGDQDDGVTLFFGRNKKIYEVKKYSDLYSLGMLYNAGTNLIYHATNTEGKLMGLSSCSEPEYSIPSPIQYNEDGTVEYRYGGNSEKPCNEALLNYIEDKFAYLLNKHGDVINLDIYKAKIAATVQWWFTEQVKNIVKYLKSLNPNIENLCLCGGCFLNCETNGIIDRMGLYKNIYCVPGPADNSIVLGLMEQLLINTGNEPLKITSPYLGPKKELSYDELLKEFFVHKEGDELKCDIGSVKYAKEYSEDFIVEQLKNNKIIVWFDGNSEYGPRALGHRSFLANPSTNEMFERLSIDVKKRESYRPLAPICTDEVYEDVFDDPNPENLTAFMLKTVKVKPKWHEILKAVIHVNQTARPQRLTKDVNPELYSLLQKWHKETGIPCLINTSLNLQNQPILENFDDLKSIFDYSKLADDTVVVINHSLCLVLK